jgi:cytosine/adenosine deaminase-related metal-dependent hydrolase
MEIFVKYLEMTPVEAIQTATGNGTISIQRDDIGTLAKGKLADVIVVDGDPTVDIRVLQDRSRLHHVFKAGTEIDLRRPWPHRYVHPKERVTQYSRETLTWQRAMSIEEEGDGHNSARVRPEQPSDDLMAPALGSSCPCSM